MGYELTGSYACTKKVYDLKLARGVASRSQCDAPKFEDWMGLAAQVDEVRYSRMTTLVRVGQEVDWKLGVEQEMVMDYSQVV